MDAWIDGLMRAFSSSKAPQHHVHLHPADPGVAERIDRLEILLSDLLRSNYSNHQLLEKVYKMAIDTSAALDAVRRATTDSASLRALLQTISDKLTDVSQQLATANANNDPAAQAQVQADLNSIAQLADTEDQAVKQALQANTSGQGTQSPPADQGQGAQPINNTGNPS